MNHLQIITSDDYERFVDDNWGHTPHTVPGPAFIALGISGEAGEVAEKVKKLYRDKGGVLTPEYRKEIGKELGDLLYYLVKEAHEMGYTLGDIMDMNYLKLIDRKARGVKSGEGDNR